jgi:hypothetical protein
MRTPRFAALALAALLAAGCGDILDEINNANDLASKPSGNRPSPAAGQARPPGKVAVKPGAAAPAGAPKPAEAKPGKGLIAQVQAWLGLGDGSRDGRLPPDPNDPMVICRLDGSSSFMLKSGCLHRRGSVVASKGVPH